MSILILLQELEFPQKAGVAGGAAARAQKCQRTQAYPLPEHSSASSEALSASSMRASLSPSSVHDQLIVMVTRGASLRYLILNLQCDGNEGTEV